MARMAAGRRARRRERADTGAMTVTESLIAEVRQLRADVARLHAAHTAVHIRHGWMKVLFKDLSTNPHTPVQGSHGGRGLVADQLPADLLPVLLHAHAVAQAR